MAEKVILFVAYLGSRGLSISTIQSYMAALCCHFQVLANPASQAPSSIPLTWQFYCEVSNATNPNKTLKAFACPS